jgi:quercetin dioxygenase-like cupin family protein
MVLGVVHRVLLDGKQTHGTMSMVELVTPPGGAIPPHTHHREEEIFHVLEGELEIWCGGHTTQLRAGDTFFAPRGIPHSPRTVGESPARVLVTLVPAGFERFFREAGELEERGEASPEVLTSILKDRYGCELLPPPGAAAP